VRGVETVITATINNIQRRRLEILVHMLPRKLQRKILREETRSAMKDSGMLKKAKQQAPHRTGALRRAIVLRAIKKSRVYVGMDLGYKSGLVKKAGKQRTQVIYGGFQERGWRPGKASNEIKAARQLVRRRQNEKASELTVRQLLNRRNKEKSASMQARESMAMKTVDGDTRRKIPGKFFLKKVADSVGPIAHRKALEGIARRVEQEMRRG
jgi:hypothetical protein